MNETRWYAASVRYQNERLAQAALSSTGFETLMPCYRTQRQWSDRVKEVEAPLFAGYVFCRFDAQDRARVLRTPGITGVVSFGGLPVPLWDSEVTALQAIVSSSVPVRPWPYLKEGDRVRVDRGPLRGTEGIVVRHQGRPRLVVAVEMLQRAVLVELDPDTIVPVWQGKYRFAAAS